MATILLSAAGAALGSAINGSVLGLSTMAVGRFIGASLGRSLDQRLMGQGAEAIETGRLDRFRLTGAGEGAPVATSFGRMRLGGHVIWATEFEERVKKSGGGGKGAPPQPEVKTYSYSVSLALAICEGEITGVGRVWADGAELPLSDLNMRVYTGSRTQHPDPKIEAVEGTDMVPAYRGTAYVVIEDLELARFGNRVPQFSFEVTRPAQNAPQEVPFAIRGVALMPGTGEYALATEPVAMAFGDDATAIANVNSPSEEPDIVTSLRALRDEVPNCESVSLIVSWFGEDLRCGSCGIRPKVEQSEFDGKTMPWQVSGVTRATAGVVPLDDGRPVYGGTPADLSVIQAIRKMAGDGLKVMYYPFILMEQMAGNSLADPWSGAEGQPPLPWRGRITLSKAPGRDGSPDGTAAADAEVAAFFGTASAADFTLEDDAVVYSGPAEFSYRRFILHQAALCAVAGGVDAFCIGSEMRGLTQIRGASGFPAVAALRALAVECRALLGPGVKLGYAADWSEYFGYHPQDGSGDVYFHLDPLWADPLIDFVGIDIYMPLSDWRDGEGHADAGWGSIYDAGYLRANVAGGEGYDWYYPGPDARDAQRREPITDGAHDEPWVFRYKDIRSWWSERHYERSGGQRAAAPTEWVPQSKPVWFTELGCAAIDKGTNQPNKFLDPKSSESKTPYYSSGLRDELIQSRYLHAMHSYWGEAANNPVSEEYGGPMIDMSRAFVWAWDARPYPWFPGNESLWSDGPNYRRGHWITGRVSGQTLASVVAEICETAGLSDYDVSALHGFVRGSVVPQVTDGRRALQPLMLAYGFDAIERDGALVFRMRDGRAPLALAASELAVAEDIEGDIEETRGAEAEMAGRVRLRFLLADADHQNAAEETVLPDEATHAVAETDLALSMTRAEGRLTLERWLSEARIARDTLRFALPLSKLPVGAGDIVTLPAPSGATRARVDRVELTTHQLVEAVRIAPDVYAPSDFPDDPAPLRPFVPAVPVQPLFLDLPLMRGDEVPHAPYLALTARPWPGSVAVYDSATDADYALNEIIAARSVVGATETALYAAPAGRVDRGAALQLRLYSGQLQSVSDNALLSGANVLAIGDGSAGNWEILQFRDAEMISEGTWLVSHRLRGQFGTDAVIPEVWPAGSKAVVLDGTPVQIALAAGQRRQARHYRIGPAKRAVDDPTYVYEVHAFDGNGLRPYRPAHLRVQSIASPYYDSDTPGLDALVTWIRRTRIDGDDWTLTEVPLGEESEAYLLRVSQNGVLRREVELTAPVWFYSSNMRTADGVVPGYQIEVAQVSARYGTGPFATVTGYV
ncbi:glycoside hydrolase TIM-barrel-like domain-containing protein [Aestuariicoccus sp. MJ-SS9]|uniref:baseplate multidomain protein megatron n=1 Tax=Aestuariicoccus sp. MJ-SS9 TaxID=3079855 RepID=UPI002906536B|nr:glycoside hydrolase TIM-barrel-like domain-containing protein [Aestuariicoccus sp. MJ-SS9]MDU8911062.1 glycoside hydrolase TIM-barrel-like domain-containing protein [Aestuariicoccus sp. MJ-SS9]